MDLFKEIVLAKKQLAGVATVTPLTANWNLRMNLMLM